MGADPEALIASGIAFPQGRAKKVEGGYVIGGKWNFSSCSNIAEWDMLAVTVRDGDRRSTTACACCTSRSTRSSTTGRCSDARDGSMTVVAKEVFVPEYKRFACWMRAAATNSGAKSNPTRLRVPLSALGGHGIGACAVGNAQAALELTIAAVKERSTNYTGAKMRDFQAVQLRVGAAGAKIDAARLVLRKRLPRGAGNREPPRDRGSADEAALQAQSCLRGRPRHRGREHAARHGGRERHLRDLSLERIFRDAHSLAGHISFSFDAQASAGVAALAAKPNNPTL